MNEVQRGHLRQIGDLVNQLGSQVDMLRMTGDAKPAQPPQSTPDPQDKPADIAEFAARVVGAWEGNTFGWHGEPGKSAFGILGFEGDMAGRLRAYDRQRGGPGLMDSISPETQLAFAGDLFHEIDSLSCAPRGIDSLAGRVMAFDMAVNNGRYHPFFAEADRELGYSQAQPPSYVGYVKTPIKPAEQAAYLARVAAKRIDMRQHLFAAFPGLAARYHWWHERALFGFSDPLRIQARDMVIPLPPKPAPPQGSRWGSPVDPQARACIAPGWMVAQGFAAAFPEHPLVPKWMWSLAHSGLDFNAFPDDFGLPVYAAADGQVSCARDLGGTWRKVIVLAHGEGSLSRYGHLSRMSVDQGERLKRGQLIGYVGDAEGALSSHLHFDICVSGILRGQPGFKSAFESRAELKKHFTDPVSWINARGHWL